MGFIIAKHFLHLIEMFCMFALEYRTVPDRDALWCSITDIKTYNFLWSKR
jgi:hypothetical protein